MNTKRSSLALLEGFLKIVQQITMALATIALAVLIVTFGWLVFGRYVLNVTPTWVEQLALVLICYIAFLGAAAGVRDDTHLGVTIFREMLPDIMRRTLIIGIDIALAAFGIIMCLAGIQLMRFGWDSYLPMLNIPESFRTLAITSCGALIFLHAGSRVLLRIAYLSGKYQPKNLPQEF